MSIADLSSPPSYSSQLLLGGYRSRKKTVYLDFLRPQDAAEAVKVMHGQSSVQLPLRRTRLTIDPAPIHFFPAAGSSTHLASHPLKVSFASAPLQSVSLPS